MIILQGFIEWVAERKGFEPSKRFWHLHTFQACSFDRSDTSLGGANISKGIYLFQRNPNSFEKYIA